MSSQDRPRPSRAFSFRAVAVGALGLALVIVAVAAFLYVRFVRYERIAARHVPTGATVALRLDVQQAVLYEPFRKHLLPLLGGPSRPAAEGDARVLAFEQRSGIGRVDLREIVVFRGPAPKDWAVVLGGIFHRSRSPVALAMALAAVDARWKLGQDGLARYGDTGVTAADASDGVIIVGSTPEVVSAALSPAELGLSLPAGAGGFEVTRAALGEAGDASEPWAGLLASLSHVDSVRGQIELKERVTLAVKPVSADATTARAAAMQGFDILRGFSRADVSLFVRFFREGADRGHFSSGGPDGPSVLLVWEREELDRAFEAAADWIRAVGPVPTG